MTGTNVVFFISMVQLDNLEECEYILTISNVSNVGICIVLCSVAVLLSLTYTSDDSGYEFSMRVYMYVMVLLYVDSEFEFTVT